MSAPGSRATVSKQDVDAAQAVLNAWIEARADIGYTPAMPDGLPHLRGLITQALADTHAQGHDEGVDRGRRLIGNRLRDLIEDEGL